MEMKIMQPITVGGITLKNRIMFPPLTTGYEERDGSIGEQSRAFYTRLAQGGVGYIVLGDVEGTVEDISLRSTRIRTPDQVLITVENSKVCAEYIQNANARTQRLWAFTIGLEYRTSAPQVEQLSLIHI